MSGLPSTRINYHTRVHVPVRVLRTPPDHVIVRLRPDGGSTQLPLLPRSNRALPPAAVDRDED